MIGAWLVHAFTASGALLAYLALTDAIGGNFRRAFLWLAASTMVDAVDGALARLARVKERTPEFNGSKLDDIVDYLTFVFVPAFIVHGAGLLPDGPVGFVVVAAVLLSSAYGFNREDAKTADHFFTGFPSYWNIVAVYMVALRLAPGANAAILLGTRGDGLRADRLRVSVADAAVARGDRFARRRLGGAGGVADPGAAGSTALARARLAALPGVLRAVVVLPACTAKAELKLGPTTANCNAGGRTEVRPYDCQPHAGGRAEAQPDGYLYARRRKRRRRAEL